MEVDSLKAVNAAYAVTSSANRRNKTVVTDSSGNATGVSTVSQEPTKVGVSSSKAEMVTDNHAGRDAYTIGNKESTELQDKISHEFLDKIVDEANKKISNTNNELSYSVHEKTNRIMVKVIDRTTKEVVKELPPEKTLDAVAKMWDLVGVLVDEKA